MVVSNPQVDPDVIRWGGDDAFTHSLIVGPTRCGKTATILKPMLFQTIKAKFHGEQVGVSLVEPKGDVARFLKELCDAAEIDCVILDPPIPSGDRLNVMQGELDPVAEATVAVLQSLFGKQEAFFSTVQELSTRNVTKLLKEVYKDNMDIMDVLVNLRDTHTLRGNVAKLKAQKTNPELVQFFEAELLGSLHDQYQKLVIGLRSQLENITSNSMLRPIITGNSTINLDDHLEKGGVLAVNTALGDLGKAGDAFGQFIAMHLQLATFRRKGTERTRIPHYMMFDEYSRYINPDVERFLSIAAEYRVAGIFALQSLGQIEMESGKLSAKAMKQAIMASCRNKIAFGGIEAADAKEFAEIFGKTEIVERQESYEGGFVPKIKPKMYRDTTKEVYRMHPTFLMDGMPRFHYGYKLLMNGVSKVGIANSNFVPHNWKEQFARGKVAPLDMRALDASRLELIFKFPVRLLDKRKQKRLEEEKATVQETLAKNNPFEIPHQATPEIDAEEMNRLLYEQWKQQQSTEANAPSETIAPVVISRAPTIVSRAPINRASTIDTSNEPSEQCLQPQTVEPIQGVDEPKEIIRVHEEVPSTQTTISTSDMEEAGPFEKSPFEAETLPFEKVEVMTPPMKRESDVTESKNEPPSAETVSVPTNISVPPTTEPETAAIPEEKSEEDTFW